MLPGSPTYRKATTPALEAIETTTSEFPSFDQATSIQAIFWFNPTWSAQNPPRGVIQLIHGMGEHIGRYDHFARWLAVQGFLVCGHDSVGHGATAQQPERFGILPGVDPVTVLVEDVDLLRQHVQSALPNPNTLPYFMFGHSMGSLVLRNYLPLHGEGLAGAIICGTTRPNRLLAGAGMLLAKAFVALRGADAKSPLLHRLAYGVYSKKIRHARTEFDWISSDPTAVDGFIDDEATGFMFSGAVYVALTEAAWRSSSKKASRNVPHDLPLLLIAGDEDPVGDNGRMVEKVGWELRQGGVQNVTLKLYGGMRHEILNEGGWEEVYADVISWLDELL